MSSPEAALVALLTTGSPNPVAALVGTRVYPDVLPQAPTLPAIRYSRISTARSQFRVLSRTGGKATRAQPRFQIDCYALSRAAANQLAAAVRTVLDGYAGTSASFRLDQVVVDSEGADFEPGVGPGGAPLYVTRLDFLVNHTD